MGGMHGFGSLRLDIDEAPFHFDWERRMFAVQQATGRLGLWTIDMSRAEIEAIPAEEYLIDDDYFRRWVPRLEHFAVRYGLASVEEIAAGKALVPPRAGLVAAKPASVEQFVARGNSSMRPQAAPARYKVGDRVRARNYQPATHTRLPRYVRGRIGTIAIVHGVHVFPDTNCMGVEDRQWLYSVEFDGREVWGDTADPNVMICVDVSEPNISAAA
jgi:nitrile hydratase